MFLCSKKSMKKTEEDKKIDILKMDTKVVSKWSKLPLIYKILIFVLIVVLFFVPILML